MFYLIIFFIKDGRQSSSLNSDYQDRKRNSLHNNNKQIGNKRSYNSNQPSRNDQCRESPVSKRRRMTNNIIEDEYHE
jgi:hypothetical protein